jgi:glycosyltransferase involved in cell wall biosynthesis
MPGTGTKTAATKAERPIPAARCLDLTRLLRRMGRGPMTGVDRVELAWLTRFLALPDPVFGLARTSLGFLLLDRAGMEVFAAWVGGVVPDPARDPLRAFRRGQSTAVRRAEAALSVLALGRTHRLGLPRLLLRHLPAGTVYLNVGHSNLTASVLMAWHRLPGGRVQVMIHDTIPLDLPETQRPGTVASFRARLAAVALHADLAIYVSQATRRDAERHMATFGRVPPGIVAPIGVNLPTPDPTQVPPGLCPESPYFVSLGTIEPRKNHALLLDLWDRLEAEGATGPHLLILGHRGWNNDAVFQRLDALPRHGLVREAAGLSDGAVAAILQGAAALLMPSRAEGFGLPVAEAAGLGVPVVAADLPVYREMLGSFPVYLEPDDLYPWYTTIKTMSEGTPERTGTAGGTQVRLPSWDDHFNTVLSMT